MDQELLAKIQQIVGAATEALRTDIVGVKRHTDVVTEALRRMKRGRESLLSWQGSNMVFCNAVTRIMFASAPES